MINLSTFNFDETKYFKINSPEKLIFKNNEIVGKWNIGATRTKDGTTSVGNSCPSIKFNNDATAILTNVGGNTNILKWEVLNDTLILKNIKPKTKYPYFFDGKYRIDFINKNEWVHLELKSKDEFTYILSSVK